MACLRPHRTKSLMQGTHILCCHSHTPPRASRHSPPSRVPAGAGCTTQEAFLLCVAAAAPHPTTFATHPTSCLTSCDRPRIPRCYLPPQHTHITPTHTMSPSQATGPRHHRQRPPPAPRRLGPPSPAPSRASHTSCSARPRLAPRTVPASTRARRWVPASSPSWPTTWWGQRVPDGFGITAIYTKWLMPFVHQMTCRH